VSLKELQSGISSPNLQRTYCSNHGTLNIETNLCDCDKSYLGPICSIKDKSNGQTGLPQLAKDQENPCGNGGIYLGKKERRHHSATVFEYKCYCLNGFRGPNCVSGSFSIGNKFYDRSFKTKTNDTKNNSIISILTGMVILFTLIIIYLIRSKLKFKSKPKTKSNQKSPPNKRSYPYSFTQSQETPTNCQILLPDSNLRVSLQISATLQSDNSDLPQNTNSNDQRIENLSLLRPPPYSKNEMSGSDSDVV